MLPSPPPWARLSAPLIRHLQITRRFSNGLALKREIQDAYILSASRTPTAKVRFPPLSLFFFSSRPDLLIVCPLASENPLSLGCL